METALPVIFFGLLGVAMLVYAILDGYDLGIGMLLPLGTVSEKDQMIASIGPFWDANETWIVLGVGILLIAFPEAHGRILTSLYLPVTIMLFGLILRGVAFDFRVKAGLEKKDRWDRAFFIGSLIASVCQGWMLGAYITGLQSGPMSLLYSVLIAVMLPAFYIYLGSTWLLIKTDEALFDKALKWSRTAILPMAFALILISIATPLASDSIANRWFTLPNALGLMPIPISCGLVFLGMAWLINKPDIIHKGYEWLPFAGTAVIGVLSAFGLAYSLYPYIVLDELTIFETASATSSLQFVLVGVVITLPMILAYTVYVYRIFSGKATDLDYSK